MRTLVVVAALGLTVAACSSQPQSQGQSQPLSLSLSPWLEAWGPDFPQPEPGQAAVYLARGTAPEGAAPINLSIGRRVVGNLGGLNWMRFDLQPRLYDLRAFGVQSSHELIITVDPGQTRFFQIEPAEPGTTSILELSSADGRRLIRQGQHVMELAQPAQDP